MKLEITFDSELKRETELYEKNFLNDDLMKSVFTDKEREELKESLAARKLHLSIYIHFKIIGIDFYTFKIILSCIAEKSVYTQHGTLRGCAKLKGNFGDSQNCTSTKRVSM